MSSKVATKKAFCAFLIFCAVQTFRTPHEQQTQSTRTPPVIYFSKHQYNGAHITPTAVIQKTFTDANTRKKFPEASPKGPGLKHFMALAGQRTSRTLGIQGLASRPPKSNNKTPPKKNKTTESHKLTPIINTEMS